MLLQLLLQFLLFEVPLLVPINLGIVRFFYSCFLTKVNLRRFKNSFENSFHEVSSVSAKYFQLNCLTLPAIFTFFSAVVYSVFHQVP